MANTHNVCGALVSRNFRLPQPYPVLHLYEYGTLPFIALFFLFVDNNFMKYCLDIRNKRIPLCRCPKTE